ncbi:unnamed protein product [Litomosoides sigmodontis]|uniref:Uncharacterized protein n=1 Tax=Litomosoides sigmodontis TaxID=42156 RepID=A0A3P6SKG4_LITSI|nr:unnamed protein product [Litomosoides sigmodontis]
MKCIGRRILLAVATALTWNSASAKQIFAIDSECTSCSYYTTHICVSPFLHNEHLANSIEKQISSRFEPCLSEKQRSLRSTEIMESFIHSSQFQYVVASAAIAIIPGRGSQNSFHGLVQCTLKQLLSSSTLN